jgi:ferrous iron transport protein B
MMVVMSKIEKRKIRIALAGNPNVGKTTLFNSITGTRQHVGNWPGVTVEKKVGYRDYNGYNIEVVDLPGTYSLTAYSMDEVVARDHIIEDRPDVVVNIIDATNLERNLYLTTQLMELGIKLVIALNMYDLLESRGDVLNLKKLEGFLEIPIVKTVGNTGEGTEELLTEIINESKKGPHHEHVIGYGKEIENLITSIEKTIREHPKISDKYSPRWLSIKLIENDKEVMKRIKEQPLGLKRSIKEILRDTPLEELELEMVDKRYENISKVLNQVLQKREVLVTPSDMIDRVLTNKYLGIPIFLAIMWGVFELTFTFSVPFMDALDFVFVELGNYISDNVEPEWLASLLGRGIIGGVGFILIFFPTIFILFFILSFLEDSGYIARAAFIMDKLMYKIGLQGKSFIPLLLGFGCSVPAIMAARTIESKKDRLITILVNPFVSCGARLPVYILIAGTFFGRQAGTVIFIIYALSIFMVIIATKLLRTTVIKGSPAPFIMELPPYRIPTIKTSILHMWDRGSLYLRKAGTIILGASIVIWVISSININGYIEESTKEIDDSLLVADGIIQGSGEFQGEGKFTGYLMENITINNDTTFQKGEYVNDLELSKDVALRGNGTFEGEVTFKGNGSYTGSDFTIEESFAADIGKIAEPITKPLGFNWKINTALIFGFVAKEFVVGTVGILYGVGEGGSEEGDLSDAMIDSGDFSPLIALCLMIFVLIYTPCIATIAVIKKETGKWRWSIFSMFFGFGLAWLMALIAYNVGVLAGLG